MRDKFEKPGVLNLTDEEKRVLLARLIRATRYNSVLYCTIFISVSSQE